MGGTLAAGVPGAGWTAGGGTTFGAGTGTGLGTGLTAGFFGAAGLVAAGVDGAMPAVGAVVAVGVGAEEPAALSATSLTALVPNFSVVCDDSGTVAEATRPSARTVTRCVRRFS